MWGRCGADVGQLWGSYGAAMGQRVGRDTGLQPCGTGHGEQLSGRRVDGGGKACGADVGQMWGRCGAAMGQLWGTDLAVPVAPLLQHVQGVVRPLPLAVELHSPRQPVVLHLGGRRGAGGGSGPPKKTLWGPPPPSQDTDRVWGTPGAT